MERDPALLAECRALQEAIARFPTLAAMRVSPQWSSLAPRFEALLHRVHRYDMPAAGGTRPNGVVSAGAAAAPGTTPALARVRAVHWNIEHGNWYEQVESALVSHPDLRDADLYLFNEIDLGMARAGNRDVTGDLARALARGGVWVPLFLESTIGRDDDARTSDGRKNEESLFGLAILSRWPIGRVRVVDLPSPEEVQFDLERMFGRNIALIAEVERPGAPFVAVAAHLEVHRTRAHRAAQMRFIIEALRDERRPVIFAGDWNTHTFDRGLWHSPLTGASALLMWPGGPLRRRLERPDRGAFREPLFELLRGAGFAWESFVDFAPTLQLRLDRIDEALLVHRALGATGRAMMRWAERRGALRLDWFAGRGWNGGRGHTVHGLDGRGKASDHAPIVAEFAG
ncbi:MAG: endonuclease/exonuclease/phosphatase family protein [Candidatus Eisenbacteria bacterium]